MLPAKGAHLVLQALARVKDRRWCAVFAGSGDRSTLQLYCRETGLADRIHFAGSLSKPDLDRLYAEGRMLVHASTMPESFGLVGIEAMAHGTPVVGFNLGGVGEWLIHRETGIAVEPWSADGLADGIRMLLDDQALAARLGQAAQARAREHFSPQKFLADTIALYGEALAAWRPRRH
jgi:glycosyltransferase involved in cell wall biosynthesis